MLSKHFIWRVIRDSRLLADGVQSNVLRAGAREQTQHRDQINKYSTELIDFQPGFSEKCGTVEKAVQRENQRGTYGPTLDKWISQGPFRSKQLNHQCSEMRNDVLDMRSKTDQKCTTSNDYYCIRTLLLKRGGLQSFRRLCHYETTLTRHFHTYRSCRKTNEERVEKIPDTMIESADEKDKAVEKPLQAELSSGECYTKKNIGEKENAETKSEAEEHGNSVMKISDSEKRDIADNHGVQEMSVLEEILREKETLDFEVTEKVEENLLFPNLPIIKPQGEVTISETELAEYQPDRERKIAFPTKIYNFAALVNQSETLKELIKLGVDLSVVEQTSMADKIIKMDFKKDVKPYLIFLHDIGVAPDDFGKVLTKVPYLFQEDVETLKTRVNYFKSKKFRREHIASMVSHNAKFLLMSTQRIDAKLGFFQRCFKLTGREVRQIAVHSPKTLIIHEDMIKTSKFRLSEYLGFTDLELKKMMLRYPKVFHIWPFERVEAVFNVLHHKMDIPHALMVVYPKIFDCDALSLEQRHRFLLKVDRAQYDTTKENYVSLESMVTTKDDVFCVDIAKASLAEYYNFLKTI